jgi:uncharacterized protein YkwD
MTHRHLLATALAALVALVAFVPSPARAHVEQRAVIPSARSATLDLPPALTKVLALVNKARKAHDRKPLKATACLTNKVAQPWARHMADTENMVHQDLNVVFESCTGLTTAGENIAAGYTTAAAVMNGWMHSPGHRRNILRRGFTKIGLGVARSADGTRYWVQDFGG